MKNQERTWKSRKEEKTERCLNAIDQLEQTYGKEVVDWDYLRNSVKPSPILRPSEDDDDAKQTEYEYKEKQQKGMSHVESLVLTGSAQISKCITSEINQGRNRRKKERRRKIMVHHQNR